MKLADVMDEIAARLKTISEFRSVWEYPPGSVTPPAAMLSYPDSYNPHGTYQRGAAAITLPVVVVVGKVTDRTSRDLLSQFVADSGPSSVVAVLEAKGYTAFDSLTVTGIEFDTVTIGATDHIAALFDCDIFGSGA